MILSVDLLHLLLYMEMLLSVVVFFFVFACLVQRNIAQHISRRMCAKVLLVKFGGSVVFHLTFISKSIFGLCVRCAVCTHVPRIPYSCPHKDKMKHGIVHNV